ncbi:MAG: NYN domain-containing protein [Polyangiaceae bacterium]|nr:NYN domain-containing protein [Polyangiaceae bacterium]
MRSAIFVDAENIERAGARLMRYGVLRRFVEHLGSVVVLARTYLAFDRERELCDDAFRRGKEGFRFAVERAGFETVLTVVRRFRRPDGTTVSRANADSEIIVDALFDPSTFDFVVLVSGDGDFVPAVNALQRHGKRVDVIGFEATSHALRQVASRFHNGFAVPGLVPTH